MWQPLSAKKSGAGGGNFEDQLKAYEKFRKRMEEAGVAPKKQDFSIPLIERIGTFSFSN